MVLAKGLDEIRRSAPSLDVRLVGTAAAMLQGVEAPVGDIDLLVRSRADVDKVAAALHPWPCLMAPRDLSPVPQYFTESIIAGVRFGASTVEIVCDEVGWECKGPGPWIHDVVVEVGAHVLRVAPLEIRLTSEFQRGRVDHWRPLLTHLAVTGVDRDLLQQSLSVRRIPPDLVALTQALPARA